jgi:hypothetical protein
LAGEFRLAELVIEAAGDLGCEAAYLQNKVEHRPPKVDPGR